MVGKKFLIVGLIGVISILLVGYLIFSHKTVSVTNQSSPQSINTSTVSSMDTAEAKTEVLVSLKAISSALEKKDSESFNTYVDANSVCSSVIDVIYKSFEQYLGPAAKSGIVDSCAKDMQTHVQTGGTQGSSSSPISSLEELTTNPNAMTIQQTGGKVIAILNNQNGQTSFGFRRQDNRMIWETLVLGGAH